MFSTGRAILAVVLAVLPDSSDLNMREVTLLAYHFYSLPVDASLTRGA